MTWDAAAREKLTGQTVLITNACAPASLLPETVQTETGALSLILSEGKIAHLNPQSDNSFDGPVIDLDGGMIWPCFTDIHTHLDKGHIWPRKQNPDGTFMGAITTVTEDREANWSAKDVKARMQFSLRCAYHHGTAAIRTHLDSLDKQIGISWPVFEEMRDKWRDRIDLQAASLFGIDAMDDERFLPALLPHILRADGILGSVPYPVENLDRYLDTIFQTAMEHDLTLDFHADETRDPESDCLLHIAQAAKRNGFSGKALIGHCCSLARQSADRIDRTLDAVAETGLGIVSLPLCNMYLQDRLYDGDRPITPHWRGTTLLHEMKARGIPVMIASDNTRDPFYAYGDLDALEVYREATRIAHLDHPISDWPKAITETPARFGDFTNPPHLAEGANADLILMRTRSWTELLSRPQNDRVVIRSGKAITTPLPDYRELDSII